MHIISPIPMYICIGISTFTSTCVYYLIRNLIIYDMYCLNLSLSLSATLSVHGLGGWVDTTLTFKAWTLAPKTAPRLPLHTRMYCGATGCGLDREWVQKQRLRRQSAWRHAPRPGLLRDVAGLILGCVLVLVLWKKALLRYNSKSSWLWLAT